MKYVFLEPSYGGPKDFIVATTDTDEIDGQAHITLYDVLGVDEGKFFKKKMTDLLVRDDELYDSLEDVMQEVILYIFEG